MVSNWPILESPGDTGIDGLVHVHFLTNPYGTSTPGDEFGENIWYSFFGSWKASYDFPYQDRVEIWLRDDGMVMLIWD